MSYKSHPFNLHHSLPFAPLKTMSLAPNGSFFIVSKTPTSDGKLLAVTYNGVNGALTVTEFKNLNTQLVRPSSFYL